jgi:hypothetical protein
VPTYITAPTPGIQLTNTPPGDISVTDVVEVFYDPRCGTCQGEIFLGNDTNSGTQWSYSPLPAASDCSPKGVVPCISGVQNITATRTSTAGNTSQFMSCDPLLPVDLLSFKGRRYGTDAALLTWVTATEKNNSHFDILRGRDANTFNVVGRVTGAGNSQNANYYDFTDFNLQSGDYFYALMQVDYDGKQSMSNVIKVSISNETSISIAPNVLSVGTDVTIYNYTGHNLVSVELTDLNGKILSVHNNISGNEFILPTRQLAPSMYNIRVQTTTGVFSEKIVVQ